jgi:hypothetical protein
VSGLLVQQVSLVYANTGYRLLSSVLHLGSNHKDPAHGIRADLLHPRAGHSGPGAALGALH